MRVEMVLDMGSGAATASEIFRHLQATRGKQEVTTELAKILTVLKTTLQNDKDSSSSDEETNSNATPVKNPMPTGKPPRPPFKPKAKALSSLSPAIQAKIKELEHQLAEALPNYEVSEECLSKPLDSEAQEQGQTLSVVKNTRSWIQSIQAPTRIP